MQSNRIEMHYYTYAYLREDKTPYYIGKGKGRRAYKKHQKGISVPKDKSRIIFLKQNLTEEEAFKHEIYMIDVFGRKDLRTGILRNMTNGGEGNSNPSDETRRKMSVAKKGKTRSEETKRKMSVAQKGKTFSEEHRKNMSDARKGENHHFYNKTFSEEHRKNMSNVQKGKKWWNDGCGNCKMMIECPGNGWKPGRK
jgi:hypothetical protein